MTRGTPRRSDRTAAPRRMTHWSTWTGAAVAGLLFGFLLFEPMIARMAPRQLLLETFSVVGAHRITLEDLVKASGITAGSPVRLEKRAYS